MTQFFEDYAACATATADELDRLCLRHQVTFTGPTTNTQRREALRTWLRTRMTPRVVDITYRDELAHDYMKLLVAARVAFDPVKRAAADALALQAYELSDAMLKARL